MTIKINADWRIGADAHQFIVLKRRPNGTWRSVAYFTDLMQVAMWLVHQHIRAATMTAIPVGFLEAVARIDDQLRQIEADLAPLKAITPGEVAHAVRVAGPGCLGPSGG